jgi:hypothetical protein
MDIPGLSPKFSFALSCTWLLGRVAVVVLTPFFWSYSCDNDLLLFLDLVFYSTLITVAMQLLYWSYRLYLRRSGTKANKIVQIIYFVLDYIFYGLFRFILFILAIIWIVESEHCSDEIWFYSIALCAGYFGVCWSVCWTGCVSIFVVCWDAQTL